jgi:hypothetical protein
VRERNDDFLGDHWLANMAVAAPVHVASSLTPGMYKAPTFWGKHGIRPLFGPLGLYTAWRSGDKMDRGELSQGDAALNALMLANSATHLVEPHIRDKLTTKAINAPKFGLGSIGDDLTRMIYGSSPTSQGARFRTMTLGTLGLGLPLYLYYRQGLKPESKYDHNPGGDGQLHRIR